MVELQHRAVPPDDLTIYLNANPQAAVADFDSDEFRTVKQALKRALNQDQAGLCVYCETMLDATAGQIDHIKPKGGRFAEPALTFVYSNLSHSCINNKTCGQKKKHGILPIEPGVGCNANWTLSIDGTVEPVSGLTRAQSHLIRQSRDMLGLNADANLIDERQRWLKSAIEVLRAAPGDIEQFLDSAPYRHILRTVVT